MKNIVGMSVVGSDYDELKQYNLAEIYDPTPKSKAKTSIGAASEVKDKDASPPSDVLANESGAQDDVIATEKSEDDRPVSIP